MKLLAVVLVLLVLLLVWMVARSFSRAVARRRSREPWRVAEPEIVRDECEVLIERPGEQPVFIGSVPTSRPHWEFQEALTELRLEAQDKCDALNRRTTDDSS